MFETAIAKYKRLNELAKQKGIVIFGSGDDWNIPLHELVQAFSLDFNVYNRSVKELTIDHAVEVYDTCVASLVPDLLMLHIGAGDLGRNISNLEEFAKQYCALIRHIRKKNAKCRIVIISLKNYGNNPEIFRINQCLRDIAQSERCEYEDISAKRLWNPKEMQEVISFIYDIGFVRPLKKERSIYDLAKIFFCYE